VHTLEGEDLQTRKNRINNIGIYMLSLGRLKGEKMLKGMREGAVSSPSGGTISQTPLSEPKKQKIFTKRLNSARRGTSMGGQS